MAEKYCLLLLLARTGYASQMIADRLENNPTLQENFYIIRLRDPEHPIYHIRGFEPRELPILMFGGDVLLKGDEEVMQVASKEGVGSDLENQADFAQEIMTRFLPVLSKFQVPPEQELYDHVSNTIEKLMIVLLGALVLNVPNLKEFVEANELEIPSLPLEMELQDETSVSPGVIDLEFDEIFLAPFWEFTLTPPKVSAKKWIDTLYEMYKLGLPIGSLVMSLAWYLGRHSVQRLDLTLPQQVMQCLPPSWGEFQDLRSNHGNYTGEVMLKPSLTNPYKWDQLFLAYFFKGALETVTNHHFETYEFSYEPDARYFEFHGTIAVDES